jgi:hypothetical protein
MYKSRKRRLIDEQVQLLYNKSYSTTVCTYKEMYKCHRKVTFSCIEPLKSTYMSCGFVLLEPPAEKNITVTIRTLVCFIKDVNMNLPVHCE